MAAGLLSAVISFANAQPRQKAINSSAQKTANAFKLIEKQEFGAAKILIDQVIALEPRNVAAQILAGVVSDRQNNFQAAEKHFAIAARLQPNSPETRNNYGAILLKLKRPAAAAREFSASLAVNPNQQSALVNLSQIKFAENTAASLREAKILLDKANKIATDAEILRALILVDLRLGEKSDAAAAYENYAALENSQTAAQIELGAALADSELFAQADKEFQAVLKNEPSNVEALIGSARALLSLKNIKSAGRLLETAISNGLTDGRIYAALADVYQAGGYFENAIPAMRLAIEDDRKNEAYRYRYGMLLIDTKTPAAAIIRLREAVGEFPRSARLQLGLGVAQFYDSKLTDAQTSLERALSLDAKLVPALAYLAAIKNIGGQSGEAAAFYERALLIDDRNAAVHFLFADTLLKDANADAVKVEKHLRRAIELDASIAAAHLALGRLYARQKNYEQAATEFEKNVALDPNQTEAFYQLGQIYGRLKRADEARVALAKFKELSEREKTQTKSDYSELVRRLANVKF